MLLLDPAEVGLLVGEDTGWVGEVAMGDMPTVMVMGMGVQEEVMISIGHWIEGLLRRGGGRERRSGLGRGMKLN